VRGLRNFKGGLSYIITNKKTKKMSTTNTIKSMITLVLLILCQVAFAAKWRVNNQATGPNGANYGGTAANPVFSSLGAVMSATQIGALSGDTIYVEGSINSYGDVTISKQLTIIGTGYFLNENDSTSWNELSANFGNIIIISSNVRIIGVNAGIIYLGQINTGSLTLNNITIERSRITAVVSDIDNFPQGTVVVNNLRLLRNYFTTGGGAINVFGSALNFLILNDAILSNNIFLGGLTDRFYSVVNNNVFNGTATNTFSTSEFKNNIIQQQAQVFNITAPLNAVTHNIIAATTQLPAGYNATNLVISEALQDATVFVDPLNNSTDGDYQLRPAYATATATSANLGADNTERGVFGGAYPYSLSGVGPFPVIYQVNTNGIATQNGLNVTISTQTID
jgi:hypothetical protein